MSSSRRSRRLHDPGATLVHLAPAVGVVCRASATDRALRRLDIAPTRVAEAADWDRPELKAARPARRAKFAGVDLARLVFVDQSRATTAMTRRYGLAPRVGGSTGRCRTATGR